MSMPKPVCPNMATTTPLGPPGPRRRRKQHAGLLKLDTQPSAARIRLPEGAARKVSASVRRACIPDTYAASGPNREPGRILIPGDGAAGDQEAQNKPACPAMAATRHLRAVPSQRPPSGYGLRRTCRLVTGRSHRPRSTWPNQARLTPLALTHRNNRTHCLRLEQFQIDALMSCQGVGDISMVSFLGSGKRIGYGAVCWVADKTGKGHSGEGKLL